MSQPNNIVIVLPHNRNHFRHYAQWIWKDADTWLVNPLTENDLDRLRGFQPSAVIALPEWVHGKSDAFVDRVEMMLKKMRKENV